MAARGRRRLASRSGTLCLNVWQVYCSWFGFHLALSFHLLALPSPRRSTHSPDSHAAAQRALACTQQVIPASFTAGWAFCTEIFEGILIFLQQWKICRSTSIRLAWELYLVSIRRHRLLLPGDIAREGSHEKRSTSDYPPQRAACKMIFLPALRLLTSVARQRKLW